MRAIIQRMDRGDVVGVQVVIRGDRMAMQEIRQVASDTDI
jgi:hypothetical protein